MSEDIPPCWRIRDIMYLFNNGMSPTIENLYKARYSSQYGLTGKDFRKGMEGFNPAGTANY